MSGKSKSKASEAQQLLADLDSLGAPAVGAAGSSSSETASKPGGEAEALAFIDEMTHKGGEPAKPALDRPLSRAGTPTLRKSTERVKLGGGPSTTSLTSTTSKAKAAVAAANAANENSQPASSPDATSAASGNWGWGSMWNTASAAIQQARTVVDEQVKHLPANESARNARKWGEGMLEYAKTAQLDKLGEDFKRVGISTLTDILNVVAPPISEHEVIQVWLSHDMQGYEGIESLVYRSMAKVLEQVPGGDLVVNRGQESRPKDDNAGRNLNTVDGYDAAVKLARANLTDLITTKAKTENSKPASIESPTTYSDVYMRVQPFFTSISTLESSEPLAKEAQTQQQLQFLLYFSDPMHELTHINVTQSIPSSWLAVWDNYDWVEDLVAETIRVGVEVIGQDYLVQRMGWSSQKSAEKDTHVRETSDVDKDTVLVGKE